MLQDQGIHILLAVLLVLSVISLFAWSRVWLSDAPDALKHAGVATACWFGSLATLIAYMFDVGLIG